MSRTLNLIDHLLAMGRNYQQLQQDRDALDILGRLAAFRDLPAEVAEEAQVRQAEIHLRRRKPVAARRHLSAALRNCPDSARYHYLMATALNTRTKADPERAAEHYRRALELEPNQPLCLAEFGLLTLRQGNPAEGLETLRRAAELAPNEPAVIGKLARGLRLVERTEEALQVLRAARFRNPRDGRFRKLHDDFMFRWLRRRQRTECRAAALQTEEEAPTLLPYVSRAPELPTLSGDGTIVRLDGAAVPSGPHRPHRPARRTDWKHG
jgi:tetratricopeptide (TPR) repeat protein